MGFLIDLYTQISNNSILTAFVVGAVVSWIFYRITKNDDRKVLIEAIKKEIEFHSYWLSTEYPIGIVHENWVNSL